MKYIKGYFVPNTTPGALYYLILPKQHPYERGPVYYFHFIEKERRARGVK